MKVLVTGGAGYIGSLLVPALVELGHEVVVIDNFMHKQTPLLNCCDRENLSIIIGDVRDQELIVANMKDMDFILPLACIVGQPACDKYPTDAKTINYDAIKMILDKRKKDQKIIFPTTNSGYGVGQKCAYCTEDSPMKPTSLYGRLKVEIEKEIIKSKNSITLRLATAFGISPKMRLDPLVNDFVYRAITEGFIMLFESHFKRNYIHVRDVVKAFIHCMDNFKEMKNETYNVNLRDTNLSKWELCEEIKKQVPNFRFIRADVGVDPDKRDYIVSTKKIESTGYKSDYTLQQGIKELIMGYKILDVNNFSNIINNK